MTTVHRRRTGFTLIELLVVLGIIIILVGLLIPTVAHVRRAAYGAATSAQLSTIANAIQQYYGDFHAYPGPLLNAEINPAAEPTSAAYTLYKNGPFIVESNGTQDNLQYVALGSTTVAAFPQPTTISGAENLVLGLLGGLEVSGSTSPYTFDYNANNLFQSVSAPAAKGASSLSVSRPKRYQSYLQVSTGDLSEPNSNMTGGQYTDDAGRAAGDSIIPEFMDKFSNHPMPILYLRANPGGTAVAGICGYGDDGNVLKDATGAVVTPQYDLAQLLGYTKATMASGGIGTIVGSATQDHHGLQGLGTGGNGSSTTPMTDTIASGWANGGLNGLAYLKDPTANSSTAVNSAGSARQKDGFLLISAGPDGVYGTPDDIIYPGTLNP